MEWYRLNEKNRWIKTPYGNVNGQELNECFDNTFYSALSLYSDFTLFGLPNGKGYGEERPNTISVIRIFKEVEGAWTKESLERQKRRGKH